MIDGVRIIPLKKIPDERGAVMHMLRADDPHFLEFGEIYFSMVYPGKIKGWHLHTKMTLNYAVVVGRIKLVIYDSRKDSPTYGKVQEIVTGEDNYSLIQVPPHVWNGFQGLGTERAIVANCSTVAHDPGEIQRIEWNDPSIPYEWKPAEKRPF